ncbi:MAG: sodium:calcium antiporter, partial [Longimicrobiales bacterium]
LLATVILWASCSKLEEASHRLALHYRVPDVVKGSVLTAVASSFPELMTAVLAIRVHQDFELGLSAIVGSAIYNILVIPAAAVFVRKAPLKSNRELVYREAQFYLVAVTVLLLVMSLSVIYGGAMEPSALEPSDGAAVIHGRLTRWLVAIPLALYGLYLFIQFEETRDSRSEMKVTDGINPIREWGVLLAATAVIALGVEVLLQSALSLGELLNTPTFFWGMTIVAAATSIPDMLISIKAAAMGRYGSSVSNVLGSNVFDLLVAVPLGVMLVGSVRVNFSQTVPMMGFLMVATIVMLAFMRHDMELTMREAFIMLTLYVVFGIWMALEALGVTTVLGIAGV